VSEQRSEGWWQTYFDDVFLRIYRPFLDSERTTAEVEAVTQLLPLPASRTLLDVACGWGRHSIALAEEGYEVTGVDLSTRLLEEARRGAAAAKVRVTWKHADMRELDFDGDFDAAISLFSSLGYFGSDADDARVLRGIRSALRPGGLLLLETMHRDLAARDFADRDWWTTPEGDLVWVEREFDAVAGISHEILRWRAVDGTEGEKSHQVRIRSAPEWKALLESCDLRPLEWFGDWDLDRFTHTSERLIVLAVAE
jgi:SAM-dependent methyltransferase